MPTDPGWSGGTVLSDRRDRTTDAAAADVFAALSAIGGKTGWYGGDWLWWLRGVVDKLVGGVGMRRGRRDPATLRVGDPVDFWRVEAIETDRLLRLHAEMRLPGEAWLEWRIEPDGDGCQVHQFARFHPRGLWGRAYWFSVAPFHGFVFPGLLRGIVDDACRRSSMVRPAGSGTPPEASEASVPAVLADPAGR